MILALRRLLPVVFAVALTAPSAAHALTLDSVNGRVIVAGGPENDGVIVKGPQSGKYLITSSSPVTTDDCTVVSANTYACPSSAQRVEVTLSGGKDTLMADHKAGTVVWKGGGVFGGAGNDHVIAAKTAADVLIDAAKDPGADRYEVSSDTTLSYETSAGPVNVDLVEPGGDGPAGENDNIVVLDGGVTYRLSAFDDTLVGSHTFETVWALGGDDDVSAGVGADVLFGGAGADDLQGGVGSDVVHPAGAEAPAAAGERADGGIDDDVVYFPVGTANSVVRGGGGGDDVLVITGSTAAQVSIDGIANDGIRGGTATSDVTMFSELIGTAHGDVLTGSAAHDKIRGGAGADVLNGLGGEDLLEGGDGDDTITATDGEIDDVRCGAGLDLAVTDAFDTRLACEFPLGGMKVDPPAPQG